MEIAAVIIAHRGNDFLDSKRTLLQQEDSLLELSFLKEFFKILI